MRSRRRFGPGDLGHGEAAPAADTMNARGAGAPREVPVDHRGEVAMDADSVSLLFAVLLAYVPIAIRARTVIRRERMPASEAH